ncbi:unnamed protein product [Chondrus crispus]|uniref:Uncharacterized protein n=1 Tax=Chondrus crispus TaxID=2769 RepID=R7QTJ4_CHOCR|nr:unnamed protein product [Chondrus crispus]CDF41003.1 unnamed protein product [Chondrus crispus]|eukprot:XP_005711297.1 unnamed protein product [Chondrus crispus]
MNVYTLFLVQVMLCVCRPCRIDRIRYECYLEKMNFVPEQYTVPAAGHTRPPLRLGALLGLGLLLPSSLFSFLVALSILSFNFISAFELVTTLALATSLFLFASATASSPSKSLVQTVLRNSKSSLTSSQTSRLSLSNLFFGHWRINLFTFRSHSTLTRSHLRANSRLSTRLRNSACAFRSSLRNSGSRSVKPVIVRCRSRMRRRRPGAV